MILLLKLCTMAELGLLMALVAYFRFQKRFWRSKYSTGSSKTELILELVFSRSFFFVTKKQRNKKNYHFGF